MNCPNCNAQFQAGERFCSNCGTDLSKVNQPAPVEALVEAPIEEPIQEQIYQEPQYEQPVYAENQAVAKKPSKVSGKVIGIIVGSAVALCVLVVLSIFLFSNAGEKSGPECAVYLKSDELMFTEFKKDDALEIDSNDFYEYAFEDLYYHTEVSSDGKYVLYPSDINESDYSFDVSMINTSKKKAEPEKLIKDVLGYYVNDDFTTIIYKDSSNDLYEYNIKKDEKEKLAKDVLTFYISDDFKTIVYKNDDDELLYMNVNKPEDEEEIGDDVLYLECVSDDLSKIYFTDNDNELYLSKNGAKGESVLKDFMYMVEVYESGEAYYIVEDVESASYLDFLEDDMALIDSQMPEPPMMSYPSYWSYDNLDDYYDDMDKYEENEVLWQQYYEKEERDYIREELAANSLDRYNYTLYYFDGETSTPVLENVSSYYGAFSQSGNYDLEMDIKYDVQVGHVRVQPTSEIKTIKMSEVSYYYDVTDMMYEQEEQEKVEYIVKEGSAFELDCEDYNSICFSSNGDKAYYIADADYDDETGTLYEVKISSKGIEELEYDEDVALTIPRFLDDETVIYIKDRSELNYGGDLIINGEELESDVGLWSVQKSEDGDIYFVSGDYSDGELYKYNGKDCTEIDDEVYDYYLMENGNVLYLKDYDMEGDLYLYDGGKENKQIDDDVTSVIYW